MNVKTLEQVTRRALSGENVSEKSNEMLNSGLISPTEHRSLQSLSFQIAANISAGKGSGTVAMFRPNSTWF